MTRLLMLLAVLGLVFAPLAVEAASFTAMITWGAVSGVDNYIVEEKVGTGDFVQIGTTTGTTLNKEGLVLNTAYCYRVAATNVVGKGPYSDEACGTTGALPGKPGSLQVIFIYVQ